VTIVITMCSGDRTHGSILVESADLISTHNFDQVLNKNVILTNINIILSRPIFINFLANSHTLSKVFCRRIHSSQKNAASQWHHCDENLYFTNSFIGVMAYSNFDWPSGILFLVCGGYFGIILTLTMKKTSLSGERSYACFMFIGLLTLLQSFLFCWNNWTSQPLERASGTVLVGRLCPRSSVVKPLLLLLVLLCLVSHWSLITLRDGGR